MFSVFLIHSSVVGYLSYVYFLALMNNDARNIGEVYKFLWRCMLSLFLGIFLGVGCCVLHLAFWGTASLFSKVITPFYVPNSKCLLLSVFFSLAIVRGVKWLHILVLICLFLMAKMLNVFCMPIGYLSIFGENLYSENLYSDFYNHPGYSIFPFFNWNGFLLSNCKSALHILDTSTSLDIWFTNIFFQFYTLYFHFLGGILGSVNI